jgi:hypothetical protein
MLQFIKQLVNRLTANNYQTDVERYVVSKHPTSTAEVEYWVQQYAYRRDRDFL